MTEKGNPTDRYLEVLRKLGASNEFVASEQDRTRTPVQPEKRTLRANVQEVFTRAKAKFAKRPRK